jgi:DNA (cytosine-5)-methyltransferase 1
LGEIDGFAYGFPCNDFSIVGESKGFDGVYGGLYSYGVNVLDKYFQLLDK